MDHILDDTHFVIYETNVFVTTVNVILIGENQHRVVAFFFSR